MSTSINLTLPVQLTDASGTVGTFLPEAKLRELLAERDSLLPRCKKLDRNWSGCIARLKKPSER